MLAPKLTKIVATIGPASETEDKLEALIQAGVNVFRFNTKHSTPEWHATHIQLAQSVADRLGATIGILLDLQGPEIRLETRDQQSVSIAAGTTLEIGSSFVPGVDVIIPHAAVFSELQPGAELLIDDGFIETVVEKVSSSTLTVRVKHDAVIKHRKGVNIPGLNLDFPSLIDNDIRQLDTNATSKVDFVGLSFVRNGHDIEILRSELTKRHMNAQIVAKIESQPALDHLEEIIQVSDAVMIARGDLGVEVPFEQLAYWQRHIIDQCRVANKPVIVATQMLESMISNPRPTRAEVTDIAHAIFEGTDAIMLSGESAGGKFPVRCVDTMVRIARWNETKRQVHKLAFVEKDPTGNICNAVVSIANSQTNPPITKILVFTETGFTARSLAKHRLPIPVIAVTSRQSIAETLTLSYGLTPVCLPLPADGLFGAVDELLSILIERQVLQRGETIIMIHGQHWQKSGTTNAVAILTI